MITPDHVRDRRAKLLEIECQADDARSEAADVYRRLVSDLADAIASQDVIDALVALNDPRVVSSVFDTIRLRVATTAASRVGDVEAPHKRSPQA